MKKMVSGFLLFALSASTLSIAATNTAPSDALGCLKHIEERVLNLGGRTGTLFLDACQLKDDAMPVIANYLKSNPNVTGISLNDNYISSQGIMQISDIQTLVSFSANHNAFIGDDAVKKLATNKNLQVIKLDSNAISDEGAIAIASLSSLKNISLKNNQIGDNGAKALAMIPTELINIDLSNNHIGPAGAKAFAARVGNGPYLLNLDSNSIGDEGYIALAKMPSLPILSLASNHITDTGIAASFVAPMKDNSVFLAHNDITNKGIQAFIENNKDNLPIGELSLRFNHLSASGIAMLNGYVDSLMADGNDGEGAGNIKSKWPALDEKCMKNIPCEYR